MPFVLENIITFGPVPFSNIQNHTIPIMPYSVWVKNSNNVWSQEKAVIFTLGEAQEFVDELEELNDANDGDLTDALIYGYSDDPRPKTFPE